MCMCNCQRNRFVHQGKFRTVLHSRRRRIRFRCNRERTRRCGYPDRRSTAQGNRHLCNMPTRDTVPRRKWRPQCKRRCRRCTFGAHRTCRIDRRSRRFHIPCRRKRERTGKCGSRHCRPTARGSRYRSSIPSRGTLRHSRCCRSGSTTPRRNSFQSSRRYRSTPIPPGRNKRDRISPCHQGTCTRRRSTFVPLGRRLVSGSAWAVAPPLRDRVTWLRPLRRCQATLSEPAADCWPPPVYAPMRRSFDRP